MSTSVHIRTKFQSERLSRRRGRPKRAPLIAPRSVPAGTPPCLTTTRMSLRRAKGWPCVQQQVIEHLALQVAASVMYSTKTQTLQVNNSDCEPVLCKQGLASTAMAGWQLRQLEYLCCRNTCKLPLPAFMLNTSSTPIILFNVCVVKRFVRDQHKDSLHSTAEFHLLYCKFSGLCNACDCSGTTLCTCGELGTNSCKTQTDWYLAKLRCQLLLMLGESGDSMLVSVCSSRSCAWVPNFLCVCLNVQQSGNAMLACTRVEKSKFARDNVVLTKSNGKYWAGRVHALLSHAPPGWEDCHLSEEANVAEVDWFADAVPAACISDGLSVCLGCPVFKRLSR